MAKVYFSRKNCNFCRKKVDVIDYRDVGLLNRYLTNWGKIKPGRDTGTCTKHQRRLTEALKHARFMGMIAYVKR